MKTTSAAPETQPVPVHLLQGQSTHPRVLAICALDLMAWKLLLPWLSALRDAGNEVHIACARTTYFEQLEGAGFHLHHVALQRRMNPLVHIGPLWALYRLMRRERFAAVNTHSPVAAAVGRVAAWLAHVPAVIYTVHGFFFHDDMAGWKRRGYITVEWLLGRVTSHFMFVSDEDRRVAMQEGIARHANAATTIYNGVDLDAFTQGAGPGVSSELRGKLDIPMGAPVVGIVGRVVKEKGYLEFAEMARLLSAEFGETYFLVVGDALASDRDGVMAELQQRLEADGVSGRVRFAGFTDRVAEHLRLMDVFVLPSYREGFPRSVLEAMSCGLPVVATTIRGCREAVVEGETGFLIPPRNGEALAHAVGKLLRDPALARRMGAAGRARAVRLYDEKLVQQLFVDVIESALGKAAAPRQGWSARVASRLLDVVVSAGALLVLSPLLAAIALALRLTMGGNPIFTQRRVGAGERIFALHKFRTMTEARDSEGRLLPDGDRLTPLGSFLRAASLDELPQLWNVLKGNMRLVGPRPLLPQYLPRYSAFQRRRHATKPGITGWAQVNGRNGLTWEEKFELDVYYVEHRSLRLDLRILWMTLMQVLRRDGISQAGHATMPEFLGSPSQPGRDA